MGEELSEPMLEAKLEVMLDVMLDASGFTTENMLLWLCRKKHAVKTTYYEINCKHEHTSRLALYYLQC